MRICSEFSCVKSESSGEYLWNTEMTLCSIKCGEFIDRLSYYQFLNKVTVVS